MSGGHFSYKEYNIQEIADSIELEIEQSGAKKSKEDLDEERRWYGRDKEYYEKYPEEFYYETYPEEIITHFKEAVYTLKKAYIYAHEIDYLLSGDTGYESFLTRIEKELNELNQKYEQ